MTLAHARAEMWMNVAVTVQRWADETVGKHPGTVPFNEWPEWDPRRRLAAKYELTPAQLAGVIEEIADFAERRALICGYDDTPDN